MSTETTEEFQWIFDDGVTVTPVDPTEVIESVPVLDSATAVYDLAQNDVDNAPGTQSLAPMYPVDQPYLGTAAFPPVPEPPVNTAPRPITIVWGFIIMAIGVLAISFAAGAAVDLGLVLIWLPAICGIALITAAVFAAVKKTSAW